MLLYKIIATQLEKAGLHYEDEQLRKLDIIEYMVLEAAGALHPLQGKPLKCIFRPGHTSNVRFGDDKKRSALEFGLKNVVFSLDGPSISSEENSNFCRIVNAIQFKFSDATYNYEHQNYNTHGTLYSVIIADEEIQNAIESSSLFLAAGDLSEFTLESVLLLRKKLNLYKIADDNLSALIDRLNEKVNAYLAENFDPVYIQQALPEVERKFAALFVIAQVNTEEDSTTEEEPDFFSPRADNINMQILGGFVAALGIAAVAVGLVLLSAPSMGVVLGLGVALALTGLGLFAAGRYRNYKLDQELNDYLALDERSEAVSGCGVFS